MKNLWLDSETTGTDPNRNAIIQLAVIIDTPKGERLWESKMRPWDGAEIEDDALRISGNTREQIMDYPDPKSVYAEFLSVMGDYVEKFNKKDKFWFRGFNAGFDFQFVHSWARFCADKYLMSWFYWPPLCLAQEVARMYPDLWASLPARKLGNIAAAFDVVLPENLHDAMADITLTRDIWRKACSNQQSKPE